jgi:NADPH:quinone reductase-like Zn-dependent oxidoreductase
MTSGSGVEVGILGARVFVGGCVGEASVVSEKGVAVCPESVQAEKIITNPMTK